MLRPMSASYTHCCCVGSSVDGSVLMLTLKTCLSGEAGVAPLPLEVLLPHAAAAVKPRVASANARTRIPNRIRVLPLRLILRPSSRQLRGESAPAAGLTHQPLRPD